MSEDAPERGELKEIYKGHELEVKREQAMGGWDNLYYSAYRVRDGYGAIDSFTSDESTLVVYMGYVKEQLDEALKAVKDCYPDGKCPDCQEPIPDDATEDSSCSNCPHVFCKERETDDEFCCHYGTEAPEQKSTPMELAALLIAEVRSALESGTKHFNKAGELLETELAIITCMKEEGGVTFEPSK